MKNRFLALLCALLLLVSAVPTTFALEGETTRAADTLAALHIVQGDYALNATATRAHAAVLLVRLAGEAQAAGQTVVSGRSPYYAAPAFARSSIAYAASRGWITSLSAASFHPDDPLTADEWYAMLLRMLGYSSSDFPLGNAALFAQRIGLSSKTRSGELTRGELFQAMREALTFSYRDGSATVAEHLIACGAADRATVSALGLLDQELTAREISDRYSAAVFCLDEYESDRAFLDGVPSGNASGFFISSDGVAVTNYHTIKGAIYATVTLTTGETFPVESVIWYSPEIDLAVLRISQTSTDGNKAASFACLDIVGTEDVRSGDMVYTLGNPLGLGLAVSSGIVSATTRDVERYALPCVMNTADISKGSSGGALLNIYGHVIAVTSGAFAYGNNMYLAVPADPILTVDTTAKGLPLQEVARIEFAKEAAEN